MIKTDLEKNCGLSILHNRLKIMKKLFTSILILVALFLIATYIFIPAEVKYSRVVIAKTNLNSAIRFLTDESKWNKWWITDDSSGKVTSGTDFYYKEYSYKINRQMQNGVSIFIKNDSKQINSILKIISLSKDNVALEWSAALPSGTNPFNRIHTYSVVKKLEKNTEEIMNQMKLFLENNNNIYPVEIKKPKVTDTVLVATRFISKTYPSITSIYNSIRELKEYISINGAKETNSPMLNVIRDSSNFITMIAIPLNKSIPENGKFIFKRMVPGNILVTEVTGGNFTITEALQQMKIYINDNHLQSPAIPFESLVTDRSKEPDSSKWITRIYYPIY